MQEKKVKPKPGRESVLLGPAAARLDAALNACEETMSGQRAMATDMEALRDEILRLTEEKTGLARELEEARARAERLEAVRGEVSERLDRALGAVRSVVDR